MNNVEQMIRDANPIQGEPELLSNDELDAVLLLEILRQFHRLFEAQRNDLLAQGRDGLGEFLLGLLSLFCSLFNHFVNSSIHKPPA